VIEAHTTNGNVDIRGAAGVSRATTTNGNVSVSVSAVAGDLSASTTNGSVTLAIPKSANAELDLSTTNGSIRADNLTVTISEVSKRRLKGRLGSGGPLLSARTTNGSIIIETH
jgi:DUF4097 and DUF4098 domain-containing protein YvlB